MTTHYRTTFATQRELIERIIARARQIADHLETRDAVTADDRLAVFLGAVVAAERGLAKALERYLDDAPNRVLETYAQYSEELELDERAPPDAGVEDIAAFVLAHHRALEELAEHVAEAADTAAVREAFEALAAQVVAAVGRVIAESADAMRDL